MVIFTQLQRMLVPLRDVNGNLLMLIASTLVVLCILSWVPAFVEFVRVGVILSRLPRPKKSHWLFGVMEGMKNPQKIHKLNLMWSRTIGPIVACRVLYRRIVVIYDPVLVHKVVSARDCNKPDRPYNSLTRLTSGKGARNLVSQRTDDINWKIARKGIAPAFAQKNIKTAFVVVQEMALRLCDQLARTGESTYVDMDNMFMREAIDIISKWGFGLDVGCIEGRNDVVPGTDLLHDMHIMLTELGKSNTNPLRRFYAWATPEGQTAQRAFDNFYRFTYHLLDHIQQSGVGDDPDAQSIAAHILRLRDAKGRRYGRDYLASQAGVQFFAGFDTTGHTLAFVLYCIATSPRVEAALLEELRANDLMTTPSTPSQAQWSYETLSKLPYLHAVVREAMRLLPVVPGIARDFDHDVSVDGYVLPRNTTIICSTFPAHINCWEDGEVYRPERWLDGGGVDGYDPSQHHPSKVLPKDVYLGDALEVEPTPASLTRSGSLMASLFPRSSKDLTTRTDNGPKRFMPFSEGPRNCVGQSLAKVSVPTTVAILLSRFHFELDPDFDVDTLDYASVTLKPGFGLPMRCVPRR